MKKLFTLISGLLLASSSFAQTKYTNVIINGDMEGEQDPEFSCFWCHEWREGYTNEDGDAAQFDGPALIVEDPANPANHCARVIVRSQEQALEAGNMIADGDHIAGWDSQFFIRVKESVPAGKMVRVSMRVKADKSGVSAGTQAHAQPGEYNHWTMCGNVNFNTDWQLFEWEGIITAEQSPEEKGFYAIALNLADYRDGYVCYFDDIKFEVMDQKAPEEFESWFNFLRKETLSDYPILVNNVERTNFTGRDGVNGTDGPARMVTDADGEPALCVTSIGFNGKKEVKTAVVDEEGNAVLDEEGNPTYEISYQDVYVKENGDTLTVQNGGFGIDDWQTQFFISMPHKLSTGQQFRVVFSVRADKPATIQTQAHRAPGDYIFYQLLGDINVTEEWQTYEFEQAVTSDQNGMSTIAFNCNVLKDVNNYYFRIEEFSANSADVTNNDRILATEDIKLPVPANGADDAKAVVDLSAMIETLGIEDLVEFANDNTLRVLTEEDYSIAQQATTGVIIDEQGYFTEGDKGIILTMEEDAIEGSTASFAITNMDIDWPEGKSLNTKLVFVKDGWHYVYNVQLVDEQSYNTGVNAVTAAKPADGAIYDLTGRQVKKAGKGLYIQNGRKFLVK